MRTYAAVFDPRRNSLNFVRLVLATMVIVWHSFPLTGHDVSWEPARQLLGEGWVDGFFAISGFLIVSSWMRDPHWLRYLSARFLRIMPAFWTCLVVTAFVLAPLTAGVLGPDNLAYVMRNSALWIFQYGIAGTPDGVPYDGVWNGSLWTLAWEFLCYLGVLVLGVTGLLRRQFTVPVLFLLAWAGVAATTLGVVDNFYVERGSRFGVMFLAGALIWQYRSRIIISRRYVVAACALLLVSLALPDYRLIAALPVAYLVMVVGAVVQRPGLRMRNDISYGIYIYAFPVQQVLALWGLWQWGVAAFAVVSIAATIPLAAASWFLVEKPALRLRRRRTVAEPVAPAAQK